MNLLKAGLASLLAFGAFSFAVLPQVAAPPVITAGAVADAALDDPAFVWATALLAPDLGPTVMPQHTGATAAASDSNSKCMVKFFEPARLAPWNPIVWFQPPIAVAPLYVFQAKVICNDTVGVSELLVEQNDRIVVAGTVTNNQTGATLHSLTARLTPEQNEVLCLAIGRRTGQDGTKAGGGSFAIVAQQCFSPEEEEDQQPTLEVIKQLDPADDPGRFNLLIDGLTALADAGDNDSTGAVTVTPGAHTVSETAGTNTDLNDYATVIGGDCAADGSITLNAGDNKTCTITNTRLQPEQAALTVTKSLSPDTDPGLFNLFIDAVERASNVGDGGTTGAVIVTPGAHTVSETAGTNTDLDDYTTTFGGACDAQGNVTLAAGDNKTCIIFNTRKSSGPVFGRTIGFWGNKNGHAVLDPNNDGTLETSATIGSGSRSFTVTTIAESDKILSNDACQAGSPTIFAPCTFSDALQENTLEVLAAQTLGTTYNIQHISGYSGQTIADLDCTSFLTTTLTSAPINLSSSSTVNDVVAAANDRIGQSVSGGTTTQTQAGDLNALLGCLNRES